MIIVFGFAIGVAILSLWWGITAKPPAGRANLFAGLPQPKASESPILGLSRGLGRFVRRLLPNGLLKSLDNLLVQAGHPWKLDLSRLLAIKFVTGLSVLLLAIAVGQPFFGVLFAVVAFFLPDYLVMTQRDARQEAIRTSAADTIDQLTICVEAGLGFDAALQRVASANEGPLADELQRCLADMRSGMPRDIALTALADRTQIPEIRQLTTALIQASRHGVTIAETLRIQASDWRDRRKQAVEEKAAKLSTKMIFPIMVCFLPVFFVVLLAPALHGLTKNF